MDYKELKHDCTLAWYDGPVIQTSRDKDNNLYIEFNPLPVGSFLSQITVENLVKMIHNEITLAECFHSGSKKWKWNTDIVNYEEISEFGPDDLMDNNVYFDDICYLERITYIDELEKEQNNESV